MFQLVQNTIYMELGVNNMKTVIDCSTKEITTVPHMWIMKRIDEEYLQIQVEKKRITQEEYNMIVATPQLD